MGSTERARDNRRQPWSGAPDSVQCARGLQVKLVTFGKIQRRSAIIPRTVRCTPDSVRCTRELQAKLFTFGKIQRRFTIIHRTVSGAPEESGSELTCFGFPLRYNSPDCPVHIALSGEPSEQRLLRANGHLQKQLMRARARRSQARAKWRTGHSTVHVRCATGHPGGPRRQSSNGRNPTALVTWLAHRTVWCTIRQSAPPNG